ncbi:conserved exported protein of unknown function [Tenacibaculum sp. 190130A14a]|uniref:MORN repeat variant n=1 Tax=Tenacibaculum polynesiense TaxID=3137857 RepID=A0ABM9PD82_9FLAO
MKKKAWLLVLITIFFNSYLTAQHSEKINKLISNLKPIDSVSVNKKYRNGDKKEIGNYRVFELNNYEYHLRTGKYFTYYPGNKILAEITYDNFGIALEWKLYDGLGNLLEEFKTISIDTQINNPEKLLTNFDLIDIVREEKKYRFSDKICGWFLFKEGKKLNGKKIEEWKKYYPNGDIKKVKVY